MVIPTQWSNYIDGQWVGSEQMLGVENPATGKQIATVALATVAQAEHALQSARRCMAERSLIAMPPAQRAELLFRAAEEIRKVADAGAQVLYLENGKRLEDARDEFMEAARYFEYYAGMADKIEGVSIPLGDDYVNYTVYEPMGVSVQIVPWNFPVSLCARSLAPALAAGNACVVKSPELSPLGMCVLFEALERVGFPAGALHLRCGLGAEIGEYLVSHPQTDQIVFTGSVATGQRIQQAAAQHSTPCVMELGGKSAAIALADADIANLVDNVKAGIFFNSGQVCSALSRLLVHRSIYDETVAALQVLVQGLTIGDGGAEADITPVISAGQQAQINALCQAAVESGAQQIAGQDKSLPDHGFYVAPAIYAVQDNQLPIAQEEVFGPVLCIQAFDSMDEALRIANDSIYGLVAGVFGQDINQILYLTKRLQVGQVFVNEWFAGGIETPFGGVRLSGYGREKGQEGLYNYVQTKSITVKLRGAK